MSRAISSRARNSPGGRLRVRARRRASRDRRPFVRGARPDRHADRERCCRWSWTIAAAASCARLGADYRRTAQHRRPHPGRGERIRSCASVLRRGDAEEVGRAASPGRQRAARRPAARRGRSRRDDGRGGAVYPVVAVQRYGQGRSMVFGGEASWRWRMMARSTDRSYELFWRQAARWLAGLRPIRSPSRLPTTREPGDAIERGGARRCISTRAGRAVVATWYAAGRHRAGLRFAASPARTGISRPPFALTTGAFTTCSSRRRAARCGSGPPIAGSTLAEATAELADPRLNEGALRRIARATGGRYVRASGAAQIARGLPRPRPGGRARAAGFLAGAMGFALVVARPRRGMDPSPAMGAQMRRPILILWRSRSWLRELPRVPQPAIATRSSSPARQAAPNTKSSTANGGRRSSRSFAQSSDSPTTT